jgi:hypothetical protein
MARLLKALERVLPGSACDSFITCGHLLVAAGAFDTDEDSSASDSLMRARWARRRIDIP